jgi:hypothetical protein
MKAATRERRVAWEAGRIRARFLLFFFFSLESELEEEEEEEDDDEDEDDDDDVMTPSNHAVNHHACASPTRK